MNRYSDMTIWQLREELAAVKAELAARDVTTREPNAALGVEHPNSAGAGPAPAAPESETPETDEFSNPSTEGDNDSFVAIEHYNSLLEHARSLERRLSLAQTEIKGHMRVEDEFKARIAELEKDGARLDWFDSHRFSAYSSTSHCVVVDEQKQPRRGRVGKTLRAAIDAALKSRA